MKTNRIVLIVTLVISALGFNGCSPEDDIKNPDFQPLIINEDFAKDAMEGITLATQGWINYNESGSVKWLSGVHSHEAYARFTSFQARPDMTQPISATNPLDPTNVAWLITPEIDLDKQEGEKLTFQTAQDHVTSTLNSIEVLISTDFNGTDVTAATWTALQANFPPTTATWYEFLNSGVVDLSSYTGKAYIAFRVKGSGSNTNLDGTYQLDNVKVFN